MKAFVLTAGYATRLYPLTRERPKALLEIGGVPMLTRIVDAIAVLPELSEIVVVGNARFADAFATWGRSPRTTVPVRILNDGSTEDANKLGAIGDLAFALREAPVGDEDWLAVAGDNLLDFSLAPAHDAFAARRMPLLLVRRQPPGPDASRYNEVTLDGEGRVVRFREKPTDPQTGLAAIAFYFFPATVAGAVDRYLAGGGNPDAPGHFIAWLVDEMPVCAWRIEGDSDWFDVGSIETLQQARDRYA
ncbi:MAG: nucleotidyltransferase family protein [Proteobacteria bacterium]|nr:nucleotidyltransferase family protein [Pseudomonadota bacterium]